jgi:O-antigen ligase
MAYSRDFSFARLPLFLTWVLIYFLITNIVVTEKRFFVFMLSFLLYNLKMSQHGTLSWVKIGFAFRNWGVAGAPGWFQNSGDFGIEMTIFLPLSIFFIIALRRYWGRLKLIFFALLPITAVIGIVASSSRGAIVGGCAAALWMLAKSRYKTRAFLALAFVAATVLIIIPPEQMARLAASGEDNSSIERIDRWNLAIELGNRYPLLGVGYQNWGFYIVNSGEVNAGPGLPHNVFCDALAELGYSGLVVFLLLIWATFYTNHRTRQRSNRALGPRSFPYYMAHGLDAALVGFLVSGSFVSVLYYPFFWINLAMTTALSRTVRP